MNRYAIVIDAVVENIIDAPQGFTESATFLGSLEPGATVRLVPPGTVCGVAWLHAGGDVYAEPPPPPLSVPQAVTMRQARLALLGAGLLDDVEAAINSLDEPAKSAARIEWEYSQEVHRDRPLVQMLAPLLGLTGEQLDQLFIAASGL